MAIIKQYHKDTDTTYVYDSVSYWDEEKRQSRSKRKLLGKLDPATGEIIPTGKRGRKKTEKESGVHDRQINDLTAALTQKDIRIAALEEKNRELQDKLRQLGKQIEQLYSSFVK